MTYTDLLETWILLIFLMIVITTVNETNLRLPERLIIVTIIIRRRRRRKRKQLPLRPNH